MLSHYRPENLKEVALDGDQFVVVEEANYYVWNKKRKSQADVQIILLDRCRWPGFYFKIGTLISPSTFERII